MVHRDGDAAARTVSGARTRYRGGVMDDAAATPEPTPDPTPEIGPVTQPVTDRGGQPFERVAITVMQWVLIVGVMGYLGWAIWRVPDDSVGPAVLFFILAAIVVDLIPVPAWGGMQLSLSFPILLGVAMVFPPPIAGMIALLGSADPRELRREVSLQKALWNRAQMALSIVLGSAVFNAVADPHADWVP